MVFTRDLRVRDSPALHAAARGSFVPLFVLDDEILTGPFARPNRVAFLVDALRDLDASLRERGGRLVVRRGRWVDEVLDVARVADAAVIHIAEDVSAYARHRVDSLGVAAAAVGIEVRRHPGMTVVPPGSVTPATADCYQVFTPYHRAWLAEPWRAVVAAPRRVEVPRDIGGDGVPGVSDLVVGEPSPRLPAGGEGPARARLRAWTRHDLAAYAERHDDLPGDATSRLSPFLHFGCLSPLEVATKLRERQGGDAFVRQLCWRDFYHQVLAARPDAARDDFKDRGDTWHDDPEGLAAWKAGRTGYPVVDAGMRQLRTEGFMHNRARMVVASFLTKDLLIDWRLGAAHFLDWLVDGDVANNQLNWQWTAGTGTDANPHRVFNPTRQGLRFDPHGDYVRRHVPELAAIEGTAVHDPDPETRTRVGYPLPIVDHREAIEEFRAVRTGR